MKTQRKSGVRLKSARLNSSRLKPKGLSSLVLGVGLAALLAAPQLVAQQSLYDEVELRLAQGYAAEPIFNDQVAAGAAIFRIIDAAVQADPDREAEFRQVGLDMLDGLPRSACSGNSYQPTRQWNSFEFEEVDPKTVAEVARMFFDDGFQLTRMAEDGSHGVFPVSELSSLKQEESFWYQVLPVRDHPQPEAVFVSLYTEGNQVLVDGNLGRLQQAIDNGDETVPVVFHYNRDLVLPASAFESDDDRSAGQAIIDRYEADLVRVTLVPNWKSGDFHESMRIEELEEQFDIPEEDDVDEALWQRIDEDIAANGVTFPVIILLGGGDKRLFYSPERVAVAKSRGETTLPITFFFVGEERPNLLSGCARLIAGEGEGRVPGIASLTGTGDRPGNPGGPPVPPPPPPPVSP